MAVVTPDLAELFEEAFDANHAFLAEVQISPEALDFIGVAFDDYISRAFVVDHFYFDFFSSSSVIEVVLAT